LDPHTWFDEYLAASAMLFAIDRDPALETDPHPAEGGTRFASNGSAKSPLTRCKHSRCNGSACRDL